MDFLTVWIIGSIINFQICFSYDIYLWEKGKDISYEMIFEEFILILMSFVGLLMFITLRIIVFLMEHGEESAIKGKREKN